MSNHRSSRFSYKHLNLIKTIEFKNQCITYRLLLLNSLVQLLSMTKVKIFFKLYLLRNHNGDEEKWIEFESIIINRIL